MRQMVPSLLFDNTLQASSTLGFAMMKAVAFDLEGTVIDIERAHHQGHLAAMRDFGIDLDLNGAVGAIPHFIGGPDDEIAKEISKLLGGLVPPSDVLVRIKSYFASYLANEHCINTRPGFMAVLLWLRKHGFPTSIGSLTERSLANLLLSRSGLNKQFSPEYIVLRDDVAKLKPAPDVYILTAKRMDVSPTEQLVFEDSPNGVEAAIKAGSIAVGMPVIQSDSTIARLWQSGASRVFLGWESVDIEELLRLGATNELG